MKEVRVFLIDLCLPSETGNTLKRILDSCEEPRIHLQEGNMKGCESAVFESLFQGCISHFNPHILLLIITRSHLDQVQAFLRFMKDKSCQCPILLVIEAGGIEEIMMLLKLGVVDFIIPPLKAIDVLPRIWRLLEQRESAHSLLHSLKEKVGLRQLVGESPSFVTEVEKIPVVATCDASVLISGETGTGKELFARAIHYLSPRAGKPFVPTSCGAIPVELVENELFGHVQGAYTSASSSQAGLIQEANSGTLFLDEIGSLPLLAQVKLLRFLQEKDYRQLGSPKIHHADVRVISATNVDLERAIREARFRQDLYYRLNIIPIVLPPLRERKEDIPLLANHFAEKLASGNNGKAKRLCPEAIQRLMTYEWPGNVRELENVIERAAIFSKGATIEGSDLFLPSREGENFRESFKKAKARVIEQFEKRYIEDLLLSCRGNISRAAEASQKNRRAFWELIRKHGIDVPHLKPTGKLGTGSVS